MAELVVFAGPSACGIALADLRRGGARLLPPVRRGDIQGLLQRPSRRKRPGVIVVCDGVFQSEPAVSHAELCAALDAGWQVWGVSSLGAIRAHEMRSVGMRGFGYVYEQFALHEDFTDDEMCLIHVPDAPYFPVTEALVNVRYALQQQHASLGIPEAACQVLVDALSRLWFGDRTEQTIRRLLLSQAGVTAASADSLLAWLKRNRVKSLDLAALLRRQPWQAA